MFRLSANPSILPGNSLEEQARAAAKAGFDGIELICNESAPLDIAAARRAVEASGLAVSSIYVGHTQLIHPDYDVRETALAQMRRALAASVDLGAAGVVFYGHYAPTSVLPDLHPYKSSIELEAELLITQLRATLCDLAYALGAHLLLMPADRTCSALLTRPDHALTIRARLDNHPHLQIALHLSHLAAEGIAVEHWAGHDSVKVIRAGIQPNLDSTAAVLSRAGFSGWLVIESGQQLGFDELQSRVQTLRAAQGAP